MTYKWSMRLATTLSAALLVVGVALANAATPRGNTLYQDPNCVKSPKTCYDGTVWVERGAKRGIFSASCPQGGGRKQYTDKDAFFAISRNGSYRFDGYIHVAYEGRAVARPAHLVVSGTFVTRTKTTGTFHLYEPGCKATKFALTAY